MVCSSPDEGLYVTPFYGKFMGYHGGDIRLVSLSRSSSMVWTAKSSLSNESLFRLACKKIKVVVIFSHPQGVMFFFF